MSRISHFALHLLLFVIFGVVVGGRKCWLEESVDFSDSGEIVRNEALECSFQFCGWRLVSRDVLEEIFDVRADLEVLVRGGLVGIGIFSRV